MINVKERLDFDAKLTENALAAYFAGDDSDFGILTESMKYSLFAGGKRIRPALVLEVCKMLGGKTEAALPFACAIEMVHTYSLIHDDLPCMDNDSLRRGKPTNHTVYGEDIALLAGDALLTSAFEAASSGSETTAEAKANACLLLAKAAGAYGMVGGQTMDIKAQKDMTDMQALEKLQSLKTGMLIRASVLLGVLAAGKKLDGKEAEMLERYAKDIGLAFQIEDDILDYTSDPKTLGKDVGNDVKLGKVAFMSFMSENEAKCRIYELTDDAKCAVADIDKDGFLASLADYLAIRNY